MARRRGKRGTAASSAERQRQTAAQARLPALADFERRRLRYDRAGLAVLLVVVGFAVATRFWDLGAKVFHHDESMFAHRAFVLATTGDYNYEPILHGPFLINCLAVVFRFFGDNDVTARLPSALAGLLLLPVVWRMRDRLGNLAALLAVAMLAVSPTFLFFSRFNRNDVLFTLAAATFVLGIARFIERASLGAWLATLLSVAWMICIKETYVIFLFTAAGYVVGIAIVDALVGRRSSLACAIARLREKGSGWAARFAATTALGLAAGALLIACLYTTFFRHPEHLFGPIEALRYWAGQHTQQRIYGEFHYYIPLAVIYEFTALVLFSWGLLATLGRAPYLRGWPTWAWTGWSLALLLALWHYRFPQRFADLTHMSRGWHLWLAIQVFALGATACALLAAERRFIEAFFLWWTMTSFLAYSYAGEKVPWVSVHIFFPMIICAAIFAQKIVHEAVGDATKGSDGRTLDEPKAGLKRERSETMLEALAPLATYARSSFARRVVSIALVLAFVANAAVSLRLSFINCADVAERHVFTHTTADFKAMVADIGDIVERADRRPAERFPIVVRGEPLWPALWYFRRWRWMPKEAVVPAAPIIILDEYLDAEHREVHALTRFPWLVRTHIVRRVPFREWWHQEPLFTTFARLFDIWMVLVPKQYRMNPLTDASGRPVGLVGDPGRLPEMTIADAIEASKRAWRCIYDYLVYRHDFDPYRFPVPTRDHIAVLFCVRKDLYKKWLSRGGRHAPSRARRVRHLPGKSETAAPGEIGVDASHRLGQSLGKRPQADRRDLGTRSERLEAGEGSGDLCVADGAGECNVGSRAEIGQALALPPRPLPRSAIMQEATISDRESPSRWAPTGRARRWRQ